jgi:hypothetical protein
MEPINVSYLYLLADRPNTDQGSTKMPWPLPNPAAMAQVAHVKAYR